MVTNEQQAQWFPSECSYSICFGIRAFLRCYTWHSTPGSFAFSQMAEIHFSKPEIFRILYYYIIFTILLYYIILYKLYFLYPFIHYWNSHCRFEIPFEVRRCEAFSFVLLSGILLILQGLFLFHTNFKIVFY